MQRKGNIVSRESQVDNLVTVGVDMGGALWATAIHDWKSGRNSYHGLRDKDGKSKESLLYEKIRDLVLAGHRVQVFYEAGRYGYAPVRIMQALGAEASILRREEYFELRNLSAPGDGHSILQERAPNF